jgi:hypothetical protein
MDKFFEVIRLFHEKEKLMIASQRSFGAFVLLLIKKGGRN